jgi:hypothetical protein
MDLKHDARGSTLVEAVVAGTASLILLAHRLGTRAEQSIMATTLATARLQTLRATPWTYDLAGGVPVVPSLAQAPPDALDRNTPGFWQAVDDTGAPLGSTGAEHASFVVRWAPRPLDLGGIDARGLEVCVFAWPASDAAAPLVCVASVRARQP